MNRPARVTQADIARALRAVAQTGVSMAVEVAKDGTIRIVPVQGKIEIKNDEQPKPNEWDAVHDTAA